jgi:DNA primase
MLKIRRWSDGEAVGYLSRNIGEVTQERPKYVLPRGLQKGLELFGAWQVKEKAPLRVLYVVESPFAVMKFSQLGFAAVSPFGWSVSPEQAAILQQLSRGCIFLPDRDKRAESQNVAGLLSRYAWTKMPELPEGVDDPEKLSADQIRALTGA